uniref:Homologous recombination factor with OB-fold n=1 Tax=Neolamprologus brichardi TaxID=32507 RepID=A0A3Q4G8G4_NEOBR
MGRMPEPPAPRAPTVEPPAKMLRPSTCGQTQTLPVRTVRELSAASKTSSSTGHNLTPFPPVQHPNPRPAFPLAPPQKSDVFPGFTPTSPALSSFSRTVNKPQQPQKTCTTPRPSSQPRNLFDTVSSAPSSSPSPSHPLHTPVLTNRLVQLVSASNKLPKKRPRSEPRQPRTRRFPGPAGLLPQQGQNLDEIVVSVPQTPAHGAVARLPSQASSSQTEEEEFSGGAWAAMKMEMGLDERHPSCFLHSYSVVMVLRKVSGRLLWEKPIIPDVLIDLELKCEDLGNKSEAALKQLVRNKVPNMAVLLKSIVHTHADAKAVFKDPTGEIQGTIHRRLLEDRAEELKVGAVLLLKQVGVFSPSHRNHYLNVTSNNLLRIYAADGVSLTSTQLPPLVLVSRTAAAENKINDDLDELLGELPEDACSL